MGTVGTVGTVDFHPAGTVPTLGGGYTQPPHQTMEHTARLGSLGTVGTVGTVVGTVTVTRLGPPSAIVVGQYALAVGQYVRILPNAPREIAGRMARVDAVSAWDVVVEFERRCSQGTRIALRHDQVAPEMIEVEA